MQKAARLNHAARHHGDSAREERNHAVVHHRRSGDSRQRAVRQQPAEANRQQEQRLETLHNRQIEENQANRNHNQLSHAIGHAAEHLHLMPLDERADVIEVTAVPLEILVPVAVAVRAQGGLLGAFGLVEIPREVGGSRLAHETGDAGIARKVLHLRKRRLPVAVGVCREAAPRRQNQSHQNLLHHTHSLVSNQIPSVSR